MNDNPWRAPRLSDDANYIMRLLLRHGGGMRIGHLLKVAVLHDDALAAALNELVERLWVDVVWRGPDASRPEHLPERFRDVRRIATTRTGRHCYPFVSFL
jgi:hypothetical protein